MRTLRGVRLSGVVVLLASAMTLAGLSAASSTEQSVTLTLDHASPFVFGELIEFEVATTGVEDGAAVLLYELNVTTGALGLFDSWEIQGSAAAGTIPAQHEAVGSGPYELVAVVSPAGGGDLESNHVPFALTNPTWSVTGDLSIAAGDAATVHLNVSLPWVEGAVELFAQSSTGKWSMVRGDVPIEAGIATVVVNPQLATRYQFWIKGEDDVAVSHQGPQFVVDVLYSSLTVTPNSADEVDAAYTPGQYQPVKSTFGWGHLGTSDAVTLQWGRPNPSSSTPAILWTSQTTKMTVNGYASFAWRPTQSHIYRYKVVRGGHTTYSPQFIVARKITMTATHPHYVSPNTTFKIGVATTGWAQADGDILVTKMVGINGFVNRFPAKYGKGSATLSLPLGATAEIAYDEQALPGEWPIVLTPTRPLNVVVRELKLYQSKTFLEGSTVLLAAKVSGEQDGVGEVYARPFGSSTWFRAGSAEFVDGIARFSLSPGGSREVKVVLNGQSTNVVRLTES